MANAFWDAAEKSQAWMKGIRDRQQADLDRLNTQLGDALGSASDENHYNQIVSALDSSGIDVSQYKLKPNGPGWETMRDLALSKIGKAMAQKSVRADLDAKQASLYTPYAGTVGGAQSPNALAPQQAPAKPVTPAFDFSTLPTTPGITTPQMNPGTGESEAIPQTGTPAPTMAQAPEGLPTSPDVQSPLIQAASKIDQAYPELDAKPVTPPYVTRRPTGSPQEAVQPETRSEAIVYAPKLPGQQSFVYRFPAGFKKETDAIAGAKAKSMEENLRIADAKLGLQKDRLDLAKKTQTERQDLLERKLVQLQDYQSLDHQSKLAMARGLASADAKMYPRISAGFTLMGHIQELDKTVRSDPKVTDEVVGWLSSFGAYQDMKNELAYIMSNESQYQKSTGRSTQFIKIAMGLASLDAEIDRAYFQGQGNLAEESRKRLDAMVLGLKKAPNAQVFLSGLNCLKGYVNEIIDTALPSDFARNPQIQAAHAKKVPELERFRHEFNNAVSQGTAPGQPAVQMPANIVSAHLNIPLFTQDDPNIKSTIDSQIKDGTLQHGQVIQVKTKDGQIHEVRLP